jgi:hypothetical protein
VTHPLLLHSLCVQPSVAQFGLANDFAGDYAAQGIHAVTEPGHYAVMDGIPPEILPLVQKLAELQAAVASYQNIILNQRMRILDDGGSNWWAMLTGAVIGWVRACRFTGMVG